MGGFNPSNLVTVLNTHADDVSPVAQLNMWISFPPLLVLSRELSEFSLDPSFRGQSS
jgi:hypothetical protein